MLIVYKRTQEFQNTPYRQWYLLAALADSGCTTWHDGFAAAQNTTNLAYCGSPVLRTYSGSVLLGQPDHLHQYHQYLGVETGPHADTGKNGRPRHQTINPRFVGDCCAAWVRPVFPLRKWNNRHDGDTRTINRL